MKPSLKNKLRNIRLLLLIPMILAVVIVYAGNQYNNDEYRKIIQNLNIATEFNVDFRANIDAKMYQIVIGSATFEALDPMADIESAKELVHELGLRSSAEENKKVIAGVEILIGILEQRINDIRETYPYASLYDQNIESLNINIYMLTELIDETLGDYIRNEAKNLENLRVHLENRLNLLFFGVVLAMVSIFLIQWLFINRLFRRMATPINNLCEMTKKVGEGNFDIVTPECSIAEMQFLSDRFGAMVGRIQTLINDVRREQSRLHDAELRLLQAQINPHFLYNTFGTIIRLIENDRQEDAIQAVTSLSSFFRTMLSHGHDEITVAEEKKHIESYLEIQQIRYQDVMRYELDIDPAIEKDGIMKLSLQPLVENALYHGLKNKREQGKIYIKGRKNEDRIKFSVSDTGIGMTNEQLEKLNNAVFRSKKDRTDGGFGLWNVEERIRLRFGEGYGLKFESEYGKGTKVTLEIPAQEKNTTSAKEN